MSNKSKILIIICVFVGGGLLGRYTSPTKVQEKEVIKYQDKVVEKKVYVNNSDIKKDVVTVKLVTIKPDGTKTIETKIFDKSNIEITQQGGSLLTEQKTVEQTKEKTVEYKKEEFLISLGIKLDLNKPTVYNYGIVVNKRLFGPLYVGAFAYTDASAGLMAGLGF